MDLAAATPDISSQFASSHAELLERLAVNPTALTHLNAVARYSRFLLEAASHHPDWIEEIAESTDLPRVLSVEDFAARLETECAGSLPDGVRLARFRRRQLLRIVLRDVLGYATLGECTEELSNLADAVIEVAYRGIHRDLVERHGQPGTGFAVIALGKLGGSELNYSSDIDLMFVYGEAGETKVAPGRSGDPITHREFFKKLANRLTEVLSTYTTEGLCYRVDLRLRPEGKLGEAVISLDGAFHYYQSRARDWELQMLIKARVSAGDRKTGMALLDFCEPLTYSTTLDFSAIEVMSATRDRLDEKLASRKPGKGELDLKLMRGGIRDIEFLVQCLQRLHGGRFPWLRHGGTMLALSRLRDKGLISATEYWRLASAYQYLRNLEHRLQFWEDRQTHALPAEADALARLARNMPPQPGVEPTAESLVRRVREFTGQVIEIYERIVHAQKPMTYTSSPVAMAAEEADERAVLLPDDQPAMASSNLVRFLEQKSPILASTMQGPSQRRGQRSMELFLERALARPELMKALNEDAELGRRAVELFEYSPFFAEQLMRAPELILELHTPERMAAENGAEKFASDPGGLRRYYQRRMMRIQTDSICERKPVFETLERTSDLADEVVTLAYRLAVRQVAAKHPPKHGAYFPLDQMMIIALGRLGMREFDLASDADLIFVLPDDDSTEIIFWTRVAEKMIDVLAAYSGEGSLFAVDTRLRPLGREGVLVQTVTGMQGYFEKHAEAWEGISYMKSRAVAGNLDRATAFLGKLQELDWRRWGQSGRSRRDLRDMRIKLEKEQGAENPLKAGRGGYYDIDFILMYLRLKSAGVFFKVLNTPERIDVLEKMGHLEREDASFLRAAATFYRALDHGLRLYSGHAEGNLPKSESKLEALTELMRRWIPEREGRLALTEETREIREHTRAVFQRLFG